MLRLILIIVVAFVGYQLVRKLLSTSQQGQQSPKQYENMVSCSHCGLHLPKTEAIEKNGKPYCSEAHALADQADQ
ncbi:MAG: PP0621 family protein [Salinisphaeraceae bacterium]|nr:PP0621 family protein [Salinisphaeraceae bacterium]